MRWILAIALAAAGCANVPEPTSEHAGGDPQALTEMRAGRQLYLSKCSACHGLYSVEKYSDGEWDTHVGEMIAHKRVKLKAEEQASLLRYLTTVNGR